MCLKLKYCKSESLFFVWRDLIWQFAPLYHYSILISYAFEHIWLSLKSLLIINFLLIKIEIELLLLTVVKIYLKK